MQTTLTQQVVNIRSRYRNSRWVNDNDPMLGNPPTLGVLPTGGNTLSYFTATGYVYDVEQPNPAGTSTQPQLLEPSAYVDFFPGTQVSSFPAGFTLSVPNLNHGDGTIGDTMVPLAPITGRLINGALVGITVGSTFGVGLLANSPFLGLANPLFYHVRFRSVTYGGAPQSISNFAFQAPTVGGGTVRITSPSTPTYTYYGP
jgi:hypothetical protein